MKTGRRDGRVSNPLPHLNFRTTTAKIKPPAPASADDHQRLIPNTENSLPRVPLARLQSRRRVLRIAHQYRERPVSTRSRDHPPIRIAHEKWFFVDWPAGEPSDGARGAVGPAFGGIPEAERGTSSFRVGHRAWNVGLGGWC
jgi:hypothetical protein